MGAPSGACLKLDIYCNYECLPNAAFLNYMPISVSTYGMSNQEKKDAIKVVQEKPIMKADEMKVSPSLAIRYPPRATSATPEAIVTIRIYILLYLGMSPPERASS